MLTAVRVRELFAYLPESGALVRRVTTAWNARAGEEAGTISRGYRQVNVDGRIYPAHQVVWLWMLGTMPPRRICFRNGEKGDIRWSNLRLCGPEAELTAERLREILDYDPATGVFTYRRNRGGGKQKGQRAGNISRRSNDNGGGYRIIAIEGREYGAHRLAWLHVHGRWPAGKLDHKNTVRDDDRLDNLREATHSQNMANKGRATNNTSGFKGVSWNKNAGKWIASIQANGKYEYLGLHPTAEAAHAAYCNAAHRLFAGFARVA